MIGRLLWEKLARIPLTRTVRKKGNSKSDSYVRFALLVPGQHKVKILVIGGVLDLEPGITQVLDSRAEHHMHVSIGKNDRIRRNFWL